MKLPILATILSLAACGTTESAELSSSEQAITNPGQVGTLRLWLDGNVGVTTNSAGEVISWADQSGTGQVLGRGDAPLGVGILSASFPGSARNGVLFDTKAPSPHPYLVNSAINVTNPLTIGIVLWPANPSDGQHAILGSTAPTIAVGQECEYVITPTPPRTVCPVPSFPDVCFPAHTPSVPCLTNVCPPPEQLPPNVRLECKFGAAAGSPTTVMRDTLVTRATHHVIVTSGPKGATIRVDGGPGTSMPGFSPNGLNGVVLSGAPPWEFSGYIGEVVVYQGVLSTTAQDDLFAYFANRYPL